MARRLLREALLDLAQAGANPQGGVRQAVASLSDEALAGVGSSPTEARAGLGRLDEELSADELHTIVPLVESLLRLRLRANESTRIGWRSPRLILAPLVVIATILVPLFTYLRYPSDRYAWRASSAVRGYATSGFLGQLDAFALVAHTEYEPQPWIEIDLQKTRPVKRVIVRQRIACCQDQGLPMVVEIAGEDKQWRTVGERDTQFDSWSVKFASQPARWVRIRSTSPGTAIQLREVRID